MKIEEAIKKAIEGGWEYGRGEITSLPGFGDLFVNEKMVIDPQFWKALGKAMGWGNSKPHIWFESRKSGRMCQSCGLATETKKECNRMTNDWLYQWHKFIDHLAEGKSIETYFETL